MRHALRACAAVLAACGCTVSLAAPAQLLAPEADLRDRLQRARDAGALPAPLAMWPVTAAVARAAGLAPACGGSLRLAAQADEGERLVLGFGDGVPVQRRLQAVACGTAAGGAVAFELRAQSERSADRTRTHADGSYAALERGGALVVAGAVPRYWGPGWAGSLILGDNARPVPAISLRRADATRPFASAWLAWIGPWDAEVLFGQLQGHTEPRAPRFFGLRVEAAPRPWLTLGASRTMQWGGAGRSNSLRTFWDAFTGADNVGASGIDPANEPGNQLAGFDVRASLAPLGVPVALYTQWIGEDEAGHMPSKYMATSGVEAWFERAGWRWRAALEHVDTVVGVHDEFPGTAYRHHIYKQGYTQRGRVLGFGLGGDVRAAVLRLHAFGSGAWSGSLHLLAGTANPGGVSARAFATDSPLRAAELRVRFRPFAWAAVELRAARNRFTPQAAAEVRETAGGLSVEIRVP